MTEIWKPDFSEPDQPIPTDQEQLEIYRNRRWDIYDDLKVVDALIARVMNRMKGNV